MTASWKAGDWAMVVVRDIEAPFAFVGIPDQNWCTAKVRIEALQSLPPTMSAEDAAVLELAEKVQGIHPHETWIAFAAAVRSRAAKQEAEMPHPICDNQARYNIGHCCLQTPCVTPLPAPDDLHADGAEREAEVVDRADEEGRRVVGLRDRVVDAALDQMRAREGVGYDAAILKTNAITSVLEAALTPPAPVDPVAGLREAARNMARATHEFAKHGLKVPSEALERLDAALAIR